MAITFEKSKTSSTEGGRLEGVEVGMVDGLVMGEEEEVEVVNGEETPLTPKVEEGVVVGVVFLSR